ncbi:hypothetical protein MPH61_23380 [Peribacillus muralis]|uniref:hypothetical protein n=1 Tax=Peribacillus muralis TaxID=264697 RepID=UPI001F4DC5AB|nr:hypothetical protein [Peribacillus muralis]MCK1995468.1 hypothetical protein [Peribacillus muralis]MCK2016051.1 hypothetical protein [Peribacillus muralis]
MENNIKETTIEKQSKRPGLIRQPRVVPNLPENENVKELNDKILDDKGSISNEAIMQKKANINQQRNIKISIDTKKQIDILLKLSNHKFAYELIDSMIDVYVEHTLDHDQKRAFKTLSKILSE